MKRPGVARLLERSLPRRRVRDTVAAYRGLHDESSNGDVDARRRHYADMTNRYYDLVTDFYEYGWGPSFHFAPGRRGETFEASIARYEIYVAERLGLRPGFRALDVGCGVGGPLRAIARQSGAHVTGINNSSYQLTRAKTLNDAAGLARRCHLVRADFMKIPLRDAAFDGVYQIEATCHAPDRRPVYAEVLRVLKPGARFVGYEWCLTERYDGADPEHRAIKKGIEAGTSLPELGSIPDIERALTDVGFEVVEAHDHALTADPGAPWWVPISGDKWWTMRGFRATPFGRFVSHQLVRTLELARMLPAGATEVSALLEHGARALAQGGRRGIFTPMFFYCARRP